MRVTRSLRHHHDGAVVLELVRDGLAFQVLHDRGGVLGGQSVNSGVICGAVTRRMMKAKKPTSATVTAAMAASRAAPSDRTNSTRPCTDRAPANSGRRSRLVERPTRQVLPGYGFHPVNGTG